MFTKLWSFNSLLALLLLFVSGCKNETTTNPSETGKLVGKVVLFGDSTFSPLLNASGVKVHIEGTDHTTETSNTGDWTIPGVPAGIYNIIFSKKGFDTMTLAGLEFSGSGTDFLYDIVMPEIQEITTTIEFPNSDTTTRSLFIRDSLDPYGYIKVLPRVLTHYNWREGYAELFMSRDSSVSQLDSTNYIDILSLRGDEGPYPTDIMTVMLSRFHSKPGDTLYAFLKSKITLDYGSRRYTYSAPLIRSGNSTTSWSKPTPFILKQELQQLFLSSEIT